MVDCSDPTRFSEAAVELHRILNDREMRRVVVLVYANKMDVAGDGAMEELRGALRTDEFRADLLWRLQGSCATTGEGLVEGLEWLVASLDAAH